MKMIYVCSNIETLADGRVGDSQFYADCIREAVGDVCRFIDNLPGEYDSKSESIFRDWHGGKFYNAGCKIGEDTYGYKSRFVCTLDQNPSQETITVVNLASDYLDFLLTAISQREEADIVDREKESEAE